MEILADETRVMELSQMLGSDSGVTRNNALEMLEQAVRWKESREKPPTFPRITTVLLSGDRLNHVNHFVRLWASIRSREKLGNIFW